MKRTVTKTIHLSHDEVRLAIAQFAGAEAPIDRVKITQIGVARPRFEATIIVSEGGSDDT